MPSFLESCKEYFGSDNLYVVLDLEKSASAEDIKKAYRRLSLKVHPDRVSEEEKEIATEKFKILSKIHGTLSDQDKRKAYDETGCVDDEDGESLSFEDVINYWKRTFIKNITDDDIVNYEKKYRGGEEEKEDLITFYDKYKGDIDRILEAVPFSHPDDIPRFQDILRPLIDNGELPSHKKFFNESSAKQQARKRRYAKEAKEVEEMLKENKSKKNKEKEEEMDVDEESAMKAIMQRKKEREAGADSFFAHLEAKYANPTKKTPKSKAKAKKK